MSFSSHTAGGLAFLGAIAAAAVGFAAGFTATYANSFGHAVPVVAAALFVGLFQGLIIGLVGTVMEPTLLRWRGYRRPSRREWELHIENALQTIVDAMKLGTGSRSHPRILIMDTPVPQAWTHARTIVLSKGLIEGLDAGELAGVLAHEMVHWQQGDGLANRMVWAFGWPITVLYALGMFLAGNRFGPQKSEAHITVAATGSGAAPIPQVSVATVRRVGTTLLGFFGWLLLWPSWALIKFVMAPVAASEGRTAEYAADAGAAVVGLGGGLERALERIAPWEAGRTAWEAVLSATHPPLELRIEALENAAYTAPEPAEPITKSQAGWTWGTFVVLLAVALSPLVPSVHHTSHGWWWHW